MLIPPVENNANSGYQHEEVTIRFAKYGRFGRIGRRRYRNAVAPDGLWRIPDIELDREAT